MTARYRLRPIAATVVFSAVVVLLHRGARAHHSASRFEPEHHPHHHFHNHARRSAVTGRTGGPGCVDPTWRRRQHALQHHQRARRARLYFTILFSVRNRPAFDAAFVAGTLSNNVLGFFSVPLEDIPIDDNGTRALTVGLQSAAQEADRLNVREPGVYPLKIELRDEANTIVSNSFVTPLVVSQPEGRASVAERVRFAWVWPFSAAPSYLPNGETDPDVLAALQPSGRLGRQAIALHNDADIPVTVVPGPETMEAWLLASREQRGGRRCCSVSAHRRRHVSGTRWYLRSDRHPVAPRPRPEHGRRRRAGPGQRRVRGHGRDQPRQPNPTCSSGLVGGARSSLRERRQPRHRRRLDARFPRSPTGEHANAHRAGTNLRSHPCE